MDLTAARARLQGRGFNYLSTEQLDEALNIARNDFEDAYQWPWLETTVTGVAPLTILDLKQIIYVVDTTHDDPLTGIDVRTLAEWDPGFTSTGSPEYFWIDGLTSLKVWPASTSTQLEVRYVKESPELTSGSSVPLIPDRYQAVWIDLAVAEALKITNNYAAAAAQRADAGTRLAVLIDRYDQRNLMNGEPQATYGNSVDG